MSKKSGGAANGWKGLMQQHIEKGVFALTIVVLLLFVWTSFRKGLDENLSPKKITEAAENAGKHIASTSTIPKTQGGEKFRPEDYENRAKQTFVSGNITEWFPPTEINPRIFPNIEKRKQPILFPIEELHVKPVLINISLNDEAAREAAALEAANEMEKKRLLELKKEQDRIKKEERQNRLRGAGAGRTPAGGSGREGGSGARPGPNDPLFPGKSGKGGEKANPLNPGLNPLEEPVPDHPYLVRGTIGVSAKRVGAAVVTGLLPNKKLSDEYRRALTDGKELLVDHPPQLDLPLISGYIVERAEVVNPAESPDKLVWKDITNETEQWMLLTQHKNKVEAQEEVVPAAFMAEPTTVIRKGMHPGTARQKSLRLTYPMPRLVDRLWQRDATHPRVPLITDLSEAEALYELENSPFQTDESTVINIGDPSLDQMTATDVVVEEIEYKLFRFLDVNLEPEKSYRYRVTLTMLNPNYRVDNKFLDEPDKAKFPEINSPTSAPSAAVKLPPANRVLAGEVRAARRVTERTFAKIWFWQIDAISGVQVIKDFADAELGDLLEQAVTVKRVINYLTGQGEDLENYQFTTNGGFLVDGRNAEKNAVAGTEASGEILYIDGAGKLRASSMIRDKYLIDNWKKIYEMPDPTAIPGEGGSSPLFGPGYGGSGARGLGRPPGAGGSGGR